MFALFVERPDGTRHFLTTVDNHAWALIHGKVYSRERRAVVVGVYNDASGETYETFRFDRGAPVPVPGTNFPPRSSNGGQGFSGAPA